MVQQAKKQCDSNMTIINHTNRERQKQKSAPLKKKENKKKVCLGGTNRQILAAKLRGKIQCHTIKHENTKIIQDTRF